jgi:hypothetical protein
VFLFYPLHSDSESDSEPSNSDQYQTLRKITRKSKHNSTPLSCFFLPSTSSTTEHKTY